MLPPSSELIALMMEAARTSETLVDNYFTRQCIPEDNSEREVLGSHGGELEVDRLLG
jgi:hypothetical protein